MNWALSRKKKNNEISYILGDVRANQMKTKWNERPINLKITSVFVVLPLFL